MGSQIELLASLQAIDQRLHARDLEAEELRRELSDLEAELASARKALAECQEQKAPVDARRKDIEAQLADHETWVKERRMRLNRVRNDKEAAAAKREIEAYREINEALEEELLTLMEKLEGLDNRERQLTEQIAGLEERRRELSPTVARKLAELAKDVESERQRRESMAAKLDRGLRQQYETIFRRRGGLAVVEVRQETCQGCHMRLAPQLVNELQRSSHIHLCPSCNRILVWPSESGEQGESR